LKLKGAETTVFEACRALAQLHLLPNKNNTGENHTNSFFQAQWDEEQEYHAEANRSTTKKQEKELGRLLRLEDQLEAEWYVLQHFNSPAFTFSHSDHVLSSHQVCGLIIDHPGSSLNLTCKFSKIIGFLIPSTELIFPMWISGCKG
jgi:hypothetical protein